MQVAQTSTLITKIRTLTIFRVGLVWCGVCIIQKISCNASQRQQKANFGDEVSGLVISCPTKFSYLLVFFRCIKSFLDGV